MRYIALLHCRHGSVCVHVPFFGQAVPMNGLFFPRPSAPSLARCTPLLHVGDAHDLVLTALCLLQLLRMGRVSAAVLPVMGTIVCVLLVGYHLKDPVQDGQVCPASCRLCDKNPL